MGRKPLEAAFLRRVWASTAEAGMFASAGDIGAAPPIPLETNVLTCSCLPGAIHEGEEVGGSCAAGAVDAKGTATKDAVVAGARVPLLFAGH